MASSSNIGQTPTRIPSASRSSLSFGTPSFTSSPQPSVASTSSNKSFRTLRALLPFGPGHGGTERKTSGSGARKSMSSMDKPRPFDRSMPPSFLPPVINIDRREEPSFSESVRRSISLTTLDKEKPLPNEPPRESTPPPSVVKSPALLSPSLLPLRTPPPAEMPHTPPSPVADLSTIIEVDTSAISITKHIPSAESSAPSPLEDSQLDLSTSHVEAQVRDAIVSTPGWANPDVSVDIIADADVDPDVAALLTPNNLQLRPSLLARRPQQSSLPRLRPRSTATPPPASPGSSAGRRSPAPRPKRHSGETTTSPTFKPSYLPRSANRHRKRSLSTSTSVRPTTPGSVEWLGPRTAKAFKAAGLLDELPAPRRGSVGDLRYTSPEPSQRFGTLSRLGSLQSDRSASRLSSSRRSPSTAPTSVASWDEDVSAKHAMEMSALLGALSDSQRTTRVLREENAELRERLDTAEREKEERVAELEEENAVLRSVLDDLRREIGAGELRPPPQKRYSAASSVFPAPPTNMSMLVGDEGFDMDPTWTARRPLSTSYSTIPTSDEESLRSLRLKPEHELHLGDMDELSLYDDVGGL